MKHKIKLLLILPFIFLQMQRGFAQEVIVNLAPVDGLDITPDNILNFQVVSQLKTATHALISGSMEKTQKLTPLFQKKLSPSAILN